MNINKIISLINYPQTITSTEITLLDSILIKHPYFQSGQLLLAKGLLNTNNIRYNRQLKIAAAYSPNRERLFSLISTDNITSKNESNEKIKPKSAEEKLGVGLPLIFNESENYLFSEWLELTNVKKIERQEANLIDNFLQKNVKISRPKKEDFFKPTDFAKQSLIENNELITPTLARIYIEQEHYKKAISAYEKLILRYPKKSSFFAQQIKLITKLNNK